MAVKKNLLNAPVFLMIFILLVVAGGLVWLGFFRELSSQEIEQEINLKEKELKRYQKEKKLPPSAEVYAFFEKIHEKLQADRSEFEKLTLQSHFKIPEDVTVDGLYFREQLFKIGKELQAMAQKHQTALPENLGFSDELPETQRVILLFHQLLVMREAVSALIESSAQSLSVIKPLDIVEHKNPAGGEILFIELPIQLTAECTFQGLLNALLKLRNNRQIVIVRELHIKKTKEEQPLLVNLVASGFFTGKEK